MTRKSITTWTKLPARQGPQTKPTPLVATSHKNARPPSPITYSASIHKQGKRWAGDLREADKAQSKADARAARRRLRLFHKHGL